MHTITFFGDTDMGRIRSNNEDAFVVQNIWGENHILAVAIDGVGGYEGGEVAAALAKQSIVEYLVSYPNGECSNLLTEAVIHANNVIFEERKNSPQYSNMSCVLTAILIEVKNMQIHMAHIGDTRLYQYADGVIKKLSHDHSLVGYREELGELTEEEAMRHPQRNVIGRDVGSKFIESSDSDYVEVATFPLIPTSTLLLCSDGLCDMITSRQMAAEIAKELTTEEKVRNLIQEANNAGGKDNVTVVLVESNDPDYQPSKESKGEPLPYSVESYEEELIPEVEKRKTPRSKVALLVIVTILIIAVAGLLCYKYILPQIEKRYNIELLKRGATKHTSKTPTTKADSVELSIIEQQKAQIDSLRDENRRLQEEKEIAEQTLSNIMCE